mgnify:CR=1 FL=1
MLARENRFSFKNKLPNKTFASTFFNIRYDKNEEGLRVAVVVSKKVDKRATVRNRVKRVILESVQKELDLKKPLTLVFYAKAQAASSESLNKEVSQALNKLTKTTN